MSSDTAPSGDSPNNPGAPAFPPAIGGYRITRLLGCGGMGEVFAAVDPRLGREVAVKRMHAGLTGVPAAVARCRREGQLGARVTHDNVVPVYHAGEDAGLPFLVMPLLRGESLRDRVRNSGRLGPREAARVGREAALGLAAAHRAGLVHRDVSPGNVWLEPVGGGRVRAMILDFGLARTAECPDLTDPSAPLGTPNYRSPEQGRGEDADTRSDLYGLGATLVFAATARPPSADARVGGRLGRVLARLMHPDRDRRPASAEEAARLLAGCQRRPWGRLAGAAALALLALTAVAWAAVAPEGALLRVAEFEVLHFAANDPAAPAGVDPRGVLGRDSFRPRRGDQIEIRSSLSAKGYAYVIAFNPDRSVVLCHPATEDAPPPRAEVAAYPGPADGKVRWGLTDGVGPIVFAVVASDTPLPAFAEWMKAHGPPPWRADVAFADGAVYVDDGIAPDVFNARRPMGNTRGKGDPAPDRAPMAELAGWLRRAAGDASVRLFGFRVR